ncbi:MAG TPA: DUF1501 domain-containing protein [Tepidisphaeraceae bacterium]|jgi:uncharacterized protein (DUF1501 family)|nr:DUF1501 domain-containing protein [Tepidisphaeraceae bacterium]
MLTLSDHLPDRTCQGYSRRDFLRVGSLALGGLTLAGLLGARAEAGEIARAVTGKSVVLLFLQGGPPHIEFFDPKMTAPPDFHSITGEVKTALPGVTFGGTFPKLAAMADKLAIVRSYGTNNGEHTYQQVLSGRNALKATMGALYSRIAGTSDPKTGMPSNTLILPESLDPTLKLQRNFETDALPTLTAPGALGATYEAFNTAGGGDLNKDMRLAMSPERFQDRRSLLKSLDAFRRRMDASGAVERADQYQQQAYDVVTGGVASAFDLSKEDPRTIERYDTSKLFDIEELHRWNDMRRASNLLGRQLLMARRLCEAGCGFVTVSDCGWDYHANGNSPKQMAGIHPMGGQVDHAVSAFIEDIYQRGLSDKIMLVVTGEMGRTPRLNKDGGRDHYGKLTTLMLAGGGLKTGQVIGESDPHATEPVTTPYGPENLLATVMRGVLDVAAVRTMPEIPSDVATAISDPEPIRELF